MNDDRHGLGWILRATRFPFLEYFSFFLFCVACVRNGLRVLECLCCVVLLCCVVCDGLEVVESERVWESCLSNGSYHVSSFLEREGEREIFTSTCSLLHHVVDNNIFSN